MVLLWNFLTKYLWVPPSETGFGCAIYDLDRAYGCSIHLVCIHRKLGGYCYERESEQNPGYQMAESGDSLCSSSGRKTSRIKPVRNRSLWGASKLDDW